jgi:pimeloyl-ACP methyl ester carboxylesterase
MSEQSPTKTNAVKSLEVGLHDGSTILIEIYGSGPTLLLPVNPHPIQGEQAEQMQRYGADPALGQNLINGLSDEFRVVAFDYEGHVLRVPKPHTLTPSNIVQDLLSVADASEANQFAYYGYSWLAMIGLQSALRTQRLSALVMGGFPPINGPYNEMLHVTTAAHNMAGQAASDQDEWSASSLSKDGTQQFVTLYQALQDFDDQAIQSRLTCPRLCFVGSADEIQYGKNWGDVFVSIATPIISQRTQLEALGWDIHLMEGLNHMQSMQAPNVLAVLRPWLISRLVHKRLGLGTMHISVSR